MALRPKAVEVSSTVERYLVLPRFLQTYTKKSLFMLARVGDPEFNLIGSHGYLFLNNASLWENRFFCANYSVIINAISFIQIEKKK